MKKLIILLVVLSLFLSGGTILASEAIEPNSDVEPFGLDWECLYDGENRYVCGWCLGRNICKEEGGGYFDDKCVMACSILCTFVSGSPAQAACLAACYAGCYVEPYTIRYCCD